MSPFLTAWALITGAAAVGTLALSVATYVRVRRQYVPSRDFDAAHEQRGPFRPV